MSQQCKAAILLVATIIEKPTEILSIAKRSPAKIAGSQIYFLNTWSETESR